MYTVRIDDFDLRQIMMSGQVFRMYEYEPDCFRVMADDKCIELCQHGNEVSFDCDEAEYDEFWREYFDIDRDYAAMKRAVWENSADGRRGNAFLCSAVEQCYGIRILRQNFWEMLITFIISQQKQIPSIRRCVEALCERYGDVYEKSGLFYHAFPQAEKIAQGGLEGLDGLSLGYRARYIYETAVQYLNNPVTAQQLCSLSYEEAKEQLKKYSGVGEKVANCVCLFGLGMVDAFPIDVHIKDILCREFYDGELAREALTDKDYLELTQKNFSCYSGYRGIVQQWIFAYEISKDRKSRQKTEDKIIKNA